MSNSKPKKRNLNARKPKSRHEKVQCEECSAVMSQASLAAHIQLYHTEVKA